MYDKYYDSVDMTERVRINLDIYGGKKNLDYNLVKPGINNNGVNYVVPSYVRTNNK